MASTLEFPPTQAAPLEVLDVSGAPVAELQVTSREAFVLRAAVAGTEDHLGRWYGDDVVRAAEAELQQAVIAATTASWQNAGREAVQTDPVDAARNYVLNVQGRQLDRSALAPSDEQLREELEDDAVPMSAADLFDDDDELETESDPSAALTDVAEDVALNARLSSSAQEELMHELEATARPAVISISTAKIVVEALKARMGQIGDAPLREEIAEIEGKIEAALPPQVLEAPLRRRMVERARSLREVARMAGAIATTAFARVSLDLR